MNHTCASQDLASEHDGANLVSFIRESNPNLSPLGTSGPACKQAKRKKPMEPEPIATDQQDQPESRDLKLGKSVPFWKYHVLYFGTGLYLTTNPTPKHINCQALPGFYARYEGTSHNYTLTFEEIETGRKIICVEKSLEKSTACFRYKLKPTRKIENSKFTSDDPPSTIYRGAATNVQYPLPLPYEASDSHCINVETNSNRYGSWNISTVPTLTSSKVSVKAQKWSGKRNLYWHSLFSLPNTWKIGEKPNVLAMFRNCESGHRKRFIQSIQRILYKDSDTYGPDAPLDPFAEVKTYLRVGDGLHWDTRPRDDEPDHRYKLGWLTIYNDENIFGKGGMFDIVVALTVTVAFDLHHCCI